MNSKVLFNSRRDAVVSIPSPSDSINEAEEIETEIVEAATSKKGRGMECRMPDYKYRFKNEANAIIDAKAFEIAKRWSTF